MSLHATFDVRVPRKELPLWAGVGSLVCAEGGGQPEPSPVGQLRAGVDPWHQPCGDKCAGLTEDSE